MRKEEILKGLKERLESIEKRAKELNDNENDLYRFFIGTFIELYEKLPVDKLRMNEVFKIKACYKDGERCDKNRSYVIPNPFESESNDGIIWDNIKEASIDIVSGRFRYKPYLLVFEMGIYDSYYIEFGRKEGKYNGSYEIILDNKAIDEIVVYSGKPVGAFLNEGE